MGKCYSYIKFLERGERKMSIKLPPVTLGNIWNTLIAITEEIGVVLRKTAYSETVREGTDFSIAIFDAEGREVAQGNFSTAQLGSMPFLVKDILANWYPAESWKPGDAVACNDPQLGSGHLPDLYIVAPVFFNGKLVSFIGCIAHQLDVGGYWPGSVGVTGVTELVQEGLRILPMKLYMAGKPNEDLFRIIEGNVRDPVKTLGDIKAQRAALEHHGVPRIIELFNKYGIETMFTAYAEMIDQVANATREAIMALSDGVYYAEDYLDGYGPGTPPMKICEKVEIKGDMLTIDLAGSSEQVPAGYNCYPNYTRSYIHTGLKSMITPKLPVNEASLVAFKVTAPQGSFLNPYPNAPCAGRQTTGQTIVSCFNAATASLFPKKQLAAYSNVSIISYVGKNPKTGRVQVGWQVTGGTHGATGEHDGVEDIGPFIAANMPSEVWESEYSVIIKRVETIPDSGGPGKFRGSPGALVETEFLYPEGCKLVTAGERHKINPPGINRGKPGATGKIFLLRGGKEQILEPKETYALKYGDIIIHYGAGGGGNGDPLEREVEKVEEDLSEGIISIEGAKQDYGVVIDPETLMVRRDETKKLRAAIKRNSDNIPKV